MLVACMIPYQTYQWTYVDGHRSSPPRRLAAVCSWHQVQHQAAAIVRRSSSESSYKTINRYSAFSWRSHGSYMATLCLARSIVDARSDKLFLETWASMSCGARMLHIPPCFDHTRRWSLSSGTRQRDGPDYIETSLHAINLKSTAE